MLAFWVLLGFVALRVVALLIFATVLIPRGRRCPACGEDTAALERRGLLRVLPWLDRRWCLACGWSWYRKRVAREGRPVAAVPPRTPRIRSDRA
jgi:hypothetical protein